ncbi:uncharacterized protein V6R79_014731 [Siganus canaliculatus]
MDYRGLPRPDPGHHSSRRRDREDYQRYERQDTDAFYQSANPNERDRLRTHPDARSRPPFISPPARPEQYPYSTQQYPYGHGHPEHKRPQSRNAYDFPSHHHWDYRDSYGYYNHDYYHGQYARPDAGWWGPQESWRTDHYQDRTHKQDHSENSYSEEYGYEQQRDRSQHYLTDYEENPSRDREDASCYYPGTLESSKNSGLSSSSYELSQYINGGEYSEPLHTSEAGHGPVPQTSAPLKYSIPHAVVSFGPAGQLLRVSPGLSARENVSQLEIHSLELILSDTKDQQDMRDFPGPLTREDMHKVDVMEFAHQRAGACMRDESLQDKKSAALLWNLLILLCRQNGQIVGSDIAELLMQGSNSDGSWQSDVPTLIDFSEGANVDTAPPRGGDLLTGDLSSFSPESSEKALQGYTKLLLAGRKKEALEAAMNNGLWGHALFLASKMDNRAYTTVLNRFTAQLSSSDPLQTIFQLLSGRIPTVSTSCGNEKWGDWRPHLAAMLSTDTGDDVIQHRAIVTMGDTLASKGLLYAAHVCYLTASVTFGVFVQKTDRLVLLSSSHRQSFKPFATNSAIQCTELYEYCQTLSHKSFSIPTFQVYKFLYACRLLDCGLASQAFHYCEVIGQAMLRHTEPFFVLTGEVIKLSDRLRHSEGQFNDAGISGAGQEPDWLKQLRVRYHSLQTGSYDGTETYQLHPERAPLSSEDQNRCLESDLEAESHDVQYQQPELLYYENPEDQEAQGTSQDMMTSPHDVGGAQDWPYANNPVSGMAAYPPPVAMVAAGQDSSCHNTDRAEIQTGPLQCTMSDLSSALAEEAASSSGAGTVSNMLNPQTIFSAGFR